MKTTSSRGYLKNHLDPSFHISDDEYEHLRSEFENEKVNNQGGETSRLARSAGLIFLVLAILFVVQRYFLPFGPDLGSIIRLIPLMGTILVVIIGFGLISQFRSRRRVAEGITPEDPAHYYSKHEEQDAVCSESHRDSSEGFSSKGNTGQNSAEGTSGQEKKAFDRSWCSDDPYAFENQKRWYRSRDEKMLFGVCGGLAERFDTDPTIVRALFALAFLSYGFSFVIYVILAIVMPKKPVHSLL